MHSWLKIKIKALWQSFLIKTLNNKGIGKQRYGVSDRVHYKAKDWWSCNSRPPAEVQALGSQRNTPRGHGETTHTVSLRRRAEDKQGAFPCKDSRTGESSKQWRRYLMAWWGLVSVFPSTGQRQRSVSVSGGQLSHTAVTPQLPLVHPSTQGRSLVTEWLLTGLVGEML